MSRTGFSKEQKTKLKQLVYDCSISRIPTSIIQQLAQEKLGLTVTENWIGRIKNRLKQDSEKEFKYLLSDNFAYKYELIKRVQEVKHIQKLQWQLASKEHLTKEDYIRLKCYSELLESTTLLTEMYNALPGIDSFEPQLTEKELKRRHKELLQRELPPTKF